MILTKHDFPDFIEAIVADVPDCISTIEDYKKYIYEMASLTGSTLQIEDVEARVDDQEWIVRIVLKDSEYECKVKATHYFDLAILDILNTIILAIDSKESRRLADMSGEVYDFAIAFVHPEQLQRLVRDNLVFRSDTWQKNQELMKAYESYLLKADISQKSIPEKWVGFFKYLNGEQITLFKWIVTKEENGEIEGIIYEGNDFQHEKKEGIPFNGKRSAGDLSFVKQYGPVPLHDIARLLELTQEELDKADTRRKVYYEGGINNTNYAMGTWRTDKTELFLGGIDFSEPESHGIWEMKLVD